MRHFKTFGATLLAAAQWPGRKLVFFVSDGFLLDVGPRSANLDTKLRRAVDAARRAGAVVYTMDAKGLAAGTLDATNNIPVDPNGRLESARCAKSRPRRTGSTRSPKRRAGAPCATPTPSPTG